MTVLLVDDQISILSGLISGIDWDKLGVTQIRSACNAYQAKEILLQNQIDILLCDIEMPGENGLALLRWARKKDMRFVCIFLTSHADFMYAKEAIQLDCFDYILQPARYDEIQSIIAKAIVRATDNHMEKNLEQYGIMAKNHISGLFQNLFSDWIAGNPMSIPTLQSMFRQLGHNLSLENECFIIWGHLLRWHSESWSTHDWIYAANNIMTELYESAHLGILAFSIDRTSLGWFVYAPSERFSNSQEILNPLNNAYFAIEQYLPCDFAFYVSSVIPLNKINEQSANMIRTKQDNVLQKKGIFLVPDAADSHSFSKSLDPAQLRRWESLLVAGEDQAAIKEITCFLEKVSTQQINLQTLRDFWIEFQYMVLDAVWKRKIHTSDLFPVLELGEKAQSMQEMKLAVEKIAGYFHQNESMTEKNDVVGEIKKYLEDNIDMPLNVSDIASALYMNPDYLSRIFKKECGVSLKEYIIHRKMESAQILLKTTTLPISAIASKLGYDNYSYFSQLYRKVIGVSPSDERKQN